VPFHGINVKYIHPSSDYCAFEKTIISFLAHNVKSGKIAETTRPTREIFTQCAIRFVLSCRQNYFSVCIAKSNVVL
jgi:hypothetical protein